MLIVTERRPGSDGILWVTEFDRDNHRWLWMILPQLVAQEISEWPRIPYSGLQKGSDLGLGNMPFYMNQVPSVFFFPYTTYTVEKWPTGAPVFMIPRLPLYRLDGRNWLSSFGSPWFDLVNPKYKDLTQTWINPQGEAVYKGLSYLEVLRNSTAAQIHLLDKVRHVYDEGRNSSDRIQINEPTRYQFDESIVTFSNTEMYLDWYISAFNDFVSKLVVRIKSCANEQNREQRMLKHQQCLITGWTINRLAVDAYIIMSVDIPYLRKWQFFGFLDALASLKNELDGTGHDRDKKANVWQDTKMAQNMLTLSFFEDELLPILKMIPVKIIQDEVINHMREIYNKVEKLKTTDYSGPELLWAYRNSRHGYTLRPDTRKMLLLDDGIVPDHLPDLTIALWHYILMSLQI